MLTPWRDYDYQRTNLTLRVPTSDNEKQKELYNKLESLAEEVFPPDVNVEFGGSTITPL